MGGDRSAGNDDGGRDGGSGSEDNGAVAGEVMKDMKAVEVKRKAMATVVEEVSGQGTEQGWARDRESSDLG